MIKSILEKLNELETLTSVQLRSRWREVFRAPAPKHISRDLLLRALTHHVQEQTEGGLSRSARRRLDQLANPERKDSVALKPPKPQLKPGTRLVREWGGDIHQVTVLDNGFDHRGTHFASLSKIAREITGTRRSGPLFFGLRKAGGQTPVANNAC